MQRLAEKPFAILGANVSENSAKALKKVMDKESLTWRSIADVPGHDRPGAIARKWNVHAGSQVTVDFTAPTADRQQAPVSAGTSES